MEFFIYFNRIVIVMMVILQGWKTFAADPAPGSACSTNNAHMRSGGPENSGVVYDLTCQGGVWVGSMTYTTTGSVGIGTTSPTSGTILDVKGTGTSQSAMLVPRDTTANRPTGVEGMIRYNTTTKSIEGYQGTTPGWGGFMSLVAKVDLTNQAGAIGNTSMFSPTADGWYIVCAFMNTTTTGTSGNLDVRFEFGGESGGSKWITLTSPSITVVHGGGGECEGTYVKSGTDLQYWTNYSGTAGSHRYTLHYRVYRAF